MIFSVSGWLIQGSNVDKKGYDRVPLSVPLHSYYVQSKFWLVQKKGTRAGSTGIYSLEDVTCVPCTCLGSRCTVLRHESTRFCPHEALWMLCVSGTSGNSRHAYPLSPLFIHMLHCPIGLHLAKHVFKEKSIKNFRMVTAEH